MKGRGFLNRIPAGSTTSSTRSGVGGEGCAGVMALLVFGGFDLDRPVQTIHVRQRTVPLPPPQEGRGRNVRRCPRLSGVWVENSDLAARRPSSVGRRTLA